MSYLEKTHEHGDIIEKCKYTNGRFGKKKKNGEPLGVTPPEQIRWQSKNDMRKLWRILDLNFGPGDLWVMLSYPAKRRPSTEQARENMKVLLRKLKRRYEKAKSIFKYVFSAGRGLRGAVHFHMVLPKFDIETIRNLWSEIVNDGEWVKTNFEPLTKLVDYERIASYIIKNSEETFSSDDPVYKKRYCMSANLEKKEVKPKIVKAKEWRKEPPERKGYYIDKERSYSWVNKYGYPFQYTVYVRLSRGRLGQNKEADVHECETHQNKAKRPADFH